MRGKFQTTDVLPGLEEEGLRQLYPSGSDVGELLLLLFYSTTPSSASYYFSMIHFVCRSIASDFKSKNIEVIIIALVR